MKIRYRSVYMVFYHLCKNKNTQRNWKLVIPGTGLQQRDGSKTYLFLYNLVYPFYLHDFMPFYP